MNDEKAARLAAIRAANAQKQGGAPTTAQIEPAASPPAGPAADTHDKAARLAAIRAANAQKQSAGAPRAAAAAVALDELPPAMSLGSVLLLLLAVAGGTFAAVVVLPTWLLGLSASLLGPEPKAYWYLARVSAFVAFALLWLSMALGLSMTNKLARVWPGGAAAFDLHQHASLLGLAAALFHALILLGDTYSNYTLGQLLVPFGSANYKPIWVGLGQIGFYVMAIVGFSFYVRAQIGCRAWRLIHFMSFGMYALALLHGLQSGTDNSVAWARGLYWVSAASVLFLMIYRMLVSRMQSAQARQQRAA